MKLIIDISEHIYASSKVLADIDGSPILKAIKEGVPLNPLGEEMRITQKAITDEKVLIGFNMAVALCNKHLRGDDDVGERSE